MALGNSVNAQSTGFQSLNAATGVWNGRTLQEGTGISITNADGTGGDPTITATGGTPPGYDVLSTVSIVDDFFGTSTGSVKVFAFGWQFSSFDATETYAEAGHPGIISNTGAAQGVCALSQATISNNPGATFGSGVITCNWIVKISTAMGSGKVVGIGMIDTITPDNGVYFYYDSNVNSGNWVLKNNKAGAITTTNTATAVTSGWHNLQITVNAAGTSVNYTADGVSLGDIATNIPICTMAPGVFFSGTPAQGLFKLDLCYFTQVLTTPRT